MGMGTGMRKFTQGLPLAFPNQQWQWQVLLGSSPWYEHVLCPWQAIPDPLNLQDSLYGTSHSPPARPVILARLGFFFLSLSPPRCAALLSPFHLPELLYPCTLHPSSISLSSPGRLWFFSCRTQAGRMAHFLSANYFRDRPRTHVKHVPTLNPTQCQISHSFCYGHHPSLGHDTGHPRVFFWQPVPIPVNTIPARVRVQFYDSCSQVPVVCHRFPWFVMGFDINPYLNIRINLV
jgi:hypothetical protein